MKTLFVTFKLHSHFTVQLKRGPILKFLDAYIIKVKSFKVEIKPNTISTTVYDSIIPQL